MVVTTADEREIEVGAGEVVTLGRDEDDATAGGTGGGANYDGDGTSDPGPGRRRRVPAGSSRMVEPHRSDRDTSGATSNGSWATRNEDLDAGTGRFVTPGTATLLGHGRGSQPRSRHDPGDGDRRPVDETLRIDAVAAGALRRYEVDLHLGGLRVRAAEGVVQPDDAGDRTTFRGDVNVSDYAEWGVGLYEVTASTTGTDCEARAFVNVTGRHPMTTGTGIMALLLLVGGAAGWPPRPEGPPHPPHPRRALPLPPTRPIRAPANPIRRSNGPARGRRCGSVPRTCSGVGDADRTTRRQQARRLEVRSLRRSRPEVLGALSGIMVGLGGSVLLQQFGFWALDVVRLFGPPVVVGLLGVALVGHRRRASEES